MAGKADFAADEWSLLCKSPMLAGMVVVAASPSGPFGVIKEMVAMGKLIAETKAKGDEITTREGIERAKPTDIQGKSPDQARAYALDQLKQVAALLRQKAPGDATAFSQWLQEVAERVASAAKEGGFLGFGGTLVSEQEKAALRDTAAALGIQAA